jgi:hypothetical protein
VSDYKIVSTNVIPSVTEVRWYVETIDHIKERHPEVPIELPSVSEAVTNAIKNPTQVESSHTNSFVYVDAETTNQSGDPLRVPVKIIEGTSGLLKSAYFATPEGTANNIIWRKSSGTA